MISKGECGTKSILEPLNSGFFFVKAKLSTIEDFSSNEGISFSEKTIGQATMSTMEDFQLTSVLQHFKQGSLSPKIFARPAFKSLNSITA